MGQILENTSCPLKFSCGWDTRVGGRGDIMTVYPDSRLAPPVFGTPECLLGGTKHSLCPGGDSIRDSYWAWSHYQARVSVGSVVSNVRLCLTVLFESQLTLSLGMYLALSFPDVA